MDIFSIISDFFFFFFYRLFLLDCRRRCHWSVVLSAQAETLIGRRLPPTPAAERGVCVCGGGGCGGEEQESHLLLYSHHSVAQEDGI